MRRLMMSTSALNAAITPKNDSPTSKVTNDRTDQHAQNRCSGNAPEDNRVRQPCQLLRHESRRETARDRPDAPHTEPYDDTRCQQHPVQDAGECRYEVCDRQQDNETRQNAPSVQSVRNENNDERENGRQ